MERPTIVCLTPVKNEAWILDRFLQCASTWADYIIVADQQSDDDTRQIASRYDKVRLIENTTSSYDEGARQKLLIRAGRRVPADGHRILIALDADEMLSANFMESDDWKRLQAADPGTVLRFRWANIGPDVSCAWVDPDWKVFGFVDDGSAHVGHPIHSPRVPLPEGSPVIDLDAIKVLHYQYADWSRMRSKQRWYQVWERLQHADKRAVTIFRQYHHMEAAVAGAEPVREEWLQAYEDLGIDMTTVRPASHYYWDEEILRLFERHGVEPFRRLNIWDVSWRDVARSAGRAPAGDLEDPRSASERAVHRWLLRTQGSAGRLPVRAAQKVLQLAGW